MNFVSQSLIYLKHWLNRNNNRKCWRQRHYQKPNQKLNQGLNLKMVEMLWNTLDIDIVKIHKMMIEQIKYLKLISQYYYYYILYIIKLWKRKSTFNKST